MSCHSKGQAHVHAAGIALDGGIKEAIDLAKRLDEHLAVASGHALLGQLYEHIDDCRYIGLVVSKAMLESEWATMERTIAVWSDPSGRKGRVIPLLLENVDMPASPDRLWKQIQEARAHANGSKEAHQ